MNADTDKQFCHCGVIAIVLINDKPKCFACWKANNFGSGSIWA